MEKKGRTQRIIYLDLLRIVSIFFMIMLHVASSNWKKVPVVSFDWKAYTLYDGVARFCVPIFVISGNESLIIQMFGKLNMKFVGGYTGYFFLGHYLHEYELSKKTRSILYLAGIISTMFTVVGTCIISSTSAGADASLFSYVMPNVVFSSIAIFLLFK